MLAWVSSASPAGNKTGPHRTLFESDLYSDEVTLTGQVCSGAGVDVLVAALATGGAWYLLQARRIAKERRRRATAAEAVLARWRGRRLLPWQFVRLAGAFLIAGSAWRASPRVVVMDGSVLVGIAAILLLLSFVQPGTTVCR
jgi:hypothetical protein